MNHQKAFSKKAIGVKVMSKVLDVGVCNHHAAFVKKNKFDNFYYLDIFLE